MPQTITVYRKVGGHRTTPLFSCCLNAQGKSPQCTGCGQCQGTTRSGRPCQRSTCRDSRFCHDHLKSNYHVVINVSRVPRSGLGLFCWTSQTIGPSERKSGADPVFRAGDFIVPYGGHELKQSTLDRLYDYTEGGRRVENAGPYAIESERKNHVMDGMCYRHAGAFANDVRGTRFRPNAEIWPDGLRALRSIYKGDEIYVNYGADYWAGQHGLDMSSKSVRINHSIPRTGAKGRYVRDGRFIPMP